MTDDHRLRAELEALERAAPSATPPLADVRPQKHWLGVGLAGATVVVAAALTLLVLGPLRSVPPAATSPSPNPPAMAETRVGDFILRISSPQSRWGANDVVTISAVLTYVGASDGTWIAGSAKPVSIEVEQQSGGDESFTTAIPAPFFCDQLGEALRLEDQWSRRTSEMGAGHWRATASADLELHATASGGSDCDSGESLGISVSIEFEVGAVGQPDVAEPSEPAPPEREVEVAGMRVTLPPGWTYHLPTFVSWGPARPVIYFSNQPMHDECFRTGHSETCDRPIDELVPDGVLIEWWSSGDYPYPTPRALPSGAPYEVSGLDAVRVDVSSADCGLHATEAQRIVLRRSDMALDQLTVCSREVSGATRTQLEELLASIEFTIVASD